jgi:Rps23 Pro-64 3,4-dihydroxylase Tpa1-like proline 4-hydroxylase
LDFSDAINTSDELVQLAIMRLRENVQTHPDDTELKIKLANAYRKAGDLEAALMTCQALLKQQPEHAFAGNLAAVLSGKTIEGLDWGNVQPVPFRRVSNFIDNDRQQLIWEIIREAQRKFVASTIGDDTLDPEIRKSLVIHENDLSSVSSWFIESVLSELVHHWGRLGVQSFKPSKTEIQLTSHHHGEFYKLHRDNSDEGKCEHRRVTYVYYFFREPARFKGGDLILFDRNTQDGSPSGTFTRVNPVHNSILFFPSDFYHLVSPVCSDSDDFEDGRFTVNGWLSDGLSDV